MAFWNPWNIKIIDVVPDFPFSGSNPDYGRISVIWSKAHSSHAAALLQYYSPILSSGALCNLSTSRERSLLKMLKVWQILCKKIEKQLWNAVLWPRAFACFIYLKMLDCIYSDFRVTFGIWGLFTLKSVSPSWLLVVRSDVITPQIPRHTYLWSQHQCQFYIDIKLFQYFFLYRWLHCF